MMPHTQNILILNVNVNQHPYIIVAQRPALLTTSASNSEFPAVL